MVQGDTDFFNHSRGQEGGVAGLFVTVWQICSYPQITCEGDYNEGKYIIMLNKVEWYWFLSLLFKFTLLDSAQSIA